MANLRDLVIDTYSNLSHKRAVGGTGVAGQTILAPTWVGDHARRLAAYKVLQSYLENVSRHFLPDKTDPATGKSVAEKDERREYGDAELLVSVARSTVIGEDVAFAVEGADDDLDDDASPDEHAAVAAAQARQEWIEGWARNERFRLKMTEVEHDSIGLGDGVYVLGWSTRKHRPRLRLFDPGFYFPVLSDGDEDEFPTRVHIAWELPVDPDRAGVVRVRRITWTLVPTPTDDAGRGRRLAYHGPEDQDADRTCVMSDAVFTIEDGDRDIDALSEARADWMLNEDGQPIRDLDLGIDFIPVVHMPNTIALKEHYGRSLLGSIAQILDDLQGADTDLAAASGVVGSPPMSVTGTVLNAKNGQVTTYGPGQVFNVADGGHIGFLDVSNALDALLKYVEHLLKRLSVNSRFPEEVLGRVTSAEAASGFALALGFGPLRGLVAEMRLVRDEKYRLLLRFAQRLAIVGGELPAGPALDAWVEFGSYMPSDLPGVIKAAAELLRARAISRPTALRMLIQAGVPIDGAEEEIRRIEAEDFEGALAFLEATGDEDATRERLGLEAPGPRPEPPPASENPPLVPPVPAA